MKKRGKKGKKEREWWSKGRMDEKEDRVEGRKDKKGQRKGEERRLQRDVGPCHQFSIF